MYVLILGANSDVAHAIAKKFAEEEKANLYLASREMEVLQKRAHDISTRYEVEAKPIYFDAIAYASHAAFYNALLPKPDGVVVAFGYLGNQRQAQSDFQEAKRIIETNYVGAVSILEIIAADFEKRGHGFIIGISSVAGERGRQSNYIYGSAKGAFTVYMSGLRNRLFKYNIQVVTAIPGFLKTKMTDGLGLPASLVLDVTRAASHIHRAYRKRKDRIYIPWFWWWIMSAIRAIPETLFKKLNL